MIVAGEEWAQGAVYKATGENLIVISLSLALGKTAGESSCCIILLSVLHL